MKKSLIALIISIIFLGTCLVLVLFSNKKVNSIAMDVPFVKDNFVINLSDNVEKEFITLTGDAKYIGEAEIVEKPEIKIGISCFYTYEDNNEEFTNLLDEDLVLKYDKDTYKGVVSFPITQNTITDYSCSYSIVDVVGSYVN